MKIAIIGAGYTGLACAWHLLHSPFRPKKLQLTVYDESGIAGGASGIAAGLLHPYVGQHARLNWKGMEGMAATRQLIQEASVALGAPTASLTGLLRVALTEEQEKNFKLTAQTYADVEWWETEKCQEKIPGFFGIRGGIFIREGITVDSKNYLNGLWKSCLLQQAELSKMPVKKLSLLHGYDRIIVAAGAGLPEIEELKEFPLTLLKGQLLELEWPESMPPLPFPTNSQAYIVMGAGGKSCVVGATYERYFESKKPDIEIAREEIFQKLSFLPQLREAKILDCRAHIRVSTAGHLPMMRKIASHVWVLTGMGSKGLLYHALFAEELSRKILLD